MTVKSMFRLHRLFHFFTAEWEEHWEFVETITLKVGGVTKLLFNEKLLPEKWCNVHRQREAAKVKLIYKSCYHCGKMVYPTNV